MKRRHTTPSYYARNAAMQAQRRFLRTGKTEAERLDDHREATANVLVLCILAAIYDKSIWKPEKHCAGENRP